MDLTIPEAVGLNMGHNQAAAVDLNANPEFAKLLYSSALAAQAAGRSILIQMRGNVGGYLKIDRIWLSKD